MPSYCFSVALLLTASLLTACGGSSAPTSSVLPTAPHSVSGTVSFPAVGTQGLRVSLAADWSLPHVAGRVLVSSRLSTSGLRTPGGTPVLQRVPAGESEQAYAERLVQSGYAVQPEYLYRSLAVSSDPGVPGNAGIGGVHQDYLSRVRALGAWTALLADGRQPVSAIVADLDTGVQLDHPELAARLLPGYDTCSALDANLACTGEDSDPSEIVDPEAGHGTSTMGVIGAAGNNGAGLAGVSWSGRTLLPIKVFGSNGVSNTATSSSVARGIDVAVARGARVINMSLGFVGADDPLIHAALVRAADAGVISVASAGNTTQDGVYYPASDANVISVGATGDTDDLACYSARPSAGQRPLDLVAPGGNAGSGTANCDVVSGTQVLLLRPGGGYGLGIGTSFSAPQVSGAAGLILGRYPSLNRAQVTAALLGSARSVPGGKMLDVQAALTAAGVSPAPAPTPAPVPVSPLNYHLIVTATQGGNTALASDTSGTLLPGASGVPYTVGNLSGSVVLSAKLQVGAGSYAGSRVSTVLNADLSGQDIAAR